MEALYVSHNVSGRTRHDVTSTAATSSTGVFYGTTSDDVIRTSAAKTRSHVTSALSTIAHSNRFSSSSSSSIPPTDVTSIFSITSVAVAMTTVAILAVVVFVIFARRRGLLHTSRDVSVVKVENPQYGVERSASCRYSNGSVLYSGPTVCLSPYISYSDDLGSHRPRDHGDVTDNYAIYRPRPGHDVSQRSFQGEAKDFELESLDTECHLLQTAIDDVEIVDESNDEIMCLPVDDIKTPRPRDSGFSESNHNQHISAIQSQL